ncbi:MAG TPA: hypothetical protein VES20_03310 [Bryobacteraceae bacterium]|nr:hypothetical protein [Bryobacteraceae bacterium]
MKRIPNEGGDTNIRDDAFYYFPADDTFQRFDARYSSPYQTYWSIYTVSAAMLKSALGIY